MLFIGLLTIIIFWLLLIVGNAGDCPIIQNNTRIVYTVNYSSLHKHNAWAYKFNDDGSISTLGWYGYNDSRSWLEPVAEIIYATKDVKIDGSSTVFFQRTPATSVRQINIYNSTLDRTLTFLEGEEIQTPLLSLPQRIAQVATIVLPVCLTLFGVLLVVFLIRSKHLLQI